MAHGIKKSMAALMVVFNMATFADAVGQMKTGKENFLPARAAQQVSHKLGGGWSGDLAGGVVGGASYAAGGAGLGAGVLTGLAGRAIGGQTPDRNKQPPFVFYPPV